MAKKKTIIEETVPDQSQPFFSDEKPLEELPCTKVKVYKISPGRPAPIFCFSEPFNASRVIDEEVIQNTSFGGGSYRVEYLDESGNVLRAVPYEVAEKPQEKQPLTAETIQIQMLRDQAQMNRELLLAVLGSGGARASTPMQELAAMWGIFQNGGPNAGAGGGQSMIDIFLKGLEVGSGKVGEMDWKQTIVESVKELAKPVATAIIATQVNKGTVPPSVMEHVVAAGNGATPPNPGATVPPDTDTLIKIGLQYMKPRILAGMEPGLAVEWIVNNAQDPQYKPFVDYALSKSFDDLVKIDPEIANPPYKAWFTFVMAGIKQSFDDMAQEQTNAG